MVAQWRWRRVLNAARRERSNPNVPGPYDDGALDERTATLR